MAKGFKHGAGGGVALKFKVVGGTSAPSNPVENTFWINTDTPITYWIFSGTPEIKEEGTVWIQTGAFSPNAFNALKGNNAILVYPLTAKQYINGVWVDKPAKVYKYDAWRDLWNGQLFDNGNQWESVTGGWVDAEQINASYAYRIPISVGSTISLDTTTYGDFRQCVARTAKRVDLSGYSTVEVDFSSFYNPDDQCACLIYIIDTSGANWGGAVVAQQGVSSIGTHRMAIPTSGSYYIAVGFIGTNRPVQSVATVSGVRLVK
jgi:hypothetical protein